MSDHSPSPPATALHTATLSSDPNSLAILRFCGWLPPMTEYSAGIINAPGSLCLPHHGLHGRFRLQVHFHAKGEEVGSLTSAEVDENGYLCLDFEEFHQNHPDANADFLLIDFFHTETIPVELYVNHVHRTTGAYLATNTTAFMGDTIFPDFHRFLMENTAFWPNMIYNNTLESVVVVMNPYDAVTRYEPFLFHPNGEQVQGDIFSLNPRRAQLFTLPELFPDLDMDRVHGVHGNALCVSSQFKCHVHVIIRDRASKIMTTFDHTTNYLV